MRARKLDHSFRKRRSPEISIEAAAHLRRASQLAPEIFAPPSFIIEQLSFQIAFSEKLRRAQSVVDSFARHGICETSRVTDERPARPSRAPRVPGLHCQTRNARSVTLRSSFKLILYQSVALFILRTRAPEIRFSMRAL